MFTVPNMYRLREGLLWSGDTDGRNGAFIIPYPPIKHVYLQCIASDTGGWEHVSVCVGIKIRKERFTPTWEQMCFTKDVFWDGEDEVIQYHPKKSEYVNCHPNVLHLWRPIGVKFPVPDSSLVGPKLR